MLSLSQTDTEPFDSVPATAPSPDLEQMQPTVLCAALAMAPLCARIPVRDVVRGWHSGIDGDRVALGGERHCEKRYQSASVEARTHQV